MNARALRLVGDKQLSAVSRQLSAAESSQCSTQDCKGLPMDVFGGMCHDCYEWAARRDYEYWKANDPDYLAARAWRRKRLREWAEKTGFALGTMAIEWWLIWEFRDYIKQCFVLWLGGAQ